jgi:hypothetical protein
MALTRGRLVSWRGNPIDRIKETAGVRDVKKKTDKSREANIEQKKEAEKRK